MILSRVGERFQEVLLRAREEVRGGTREKKEREREAVDTGLMWAREHGNLVTLQSRGLEDSVCVCVCVWGGGGVCVCVVLQSV